MLAYLFWGLFVLVCAYLFKQLYIKDEITIKDFLFLFVYIFAVLMFDVNAFVTLYLYFLFALFLYLSIPIKK